MLIVVIKVVEYPTVSWNQEKIQEALKSQDSMMRMGAIRVVQEAPKDEYVRVLIDLLNDHDRLVRINSAIALGKTRNPLAVVALIYHIVTDEDKEVQQYSLWAYRQIEYARASPKLVKVLMEGNNDDMIRFAAGEIRQKMDVKAVESLIDCFKSRQFYTWYDLDIKAVNALYEIGYMAVEPLIKALESDDMRVRVNAVYTLGKIGDDRAVQPLIEHLHDANLELRLRISDALVRMGRPSIPALIKLLGDKEREIKWIAAYSLGRIGPDAESALLSSLSDKSSRSSEDVIFALGIAGGADSFDPLYNIYSSARDDSVRAWSIIALSSIASNNYNSISDRDSLNRFLDSLGEQLKPHMLLKAPTLYSLGKVYVERAQSAGDQEQFKSNVATAVKCFDLSIIEQENLLARAFRLFYGSYLKMMTSRTPEIMNYIEKDITDLKKESEKAGNKKEIILLLNRMLNMLRQAYENKDFSFPGNFKQYSELCCMLEGFLTESGIVSEDSKKLAAKELATLHKDVEIIQGKMNLLLEAFGARGDEDSAAQTYRLSTEMAKIDTGVYDDYRVVESCLKNIVSRLSISNEEKSEIYFKILLIGKNGTSQIELVLDQIIKSLSTDKPLAVKKDRVPEKASHKTVEKAGTGRKVSLLEYAVIIVLIILIIGVIVIALGRFGYVDLPFSFLTVMLDPEYIVALP